MKTLIKKSTGEYCTVINREIITSTNPIFISDRIEKTELAQLYEVNDLDIADVFFTTKRDHKIDYVLVVYLGENKELHYFTGICKAPIEFTIQPINTTEYVLALKLKYKKEAELFCEQINKLYSTNYKVEPHMYM